MSQQLQNIGLLAAKPKMTIGPGGLANPELILRDKPFESYFGGKESEGVPQLIINEIPKCELFVEMFGGNITLSRWLHDDVDKWINEKSPRVFNAYKETVHFEKKNYKWSNLDFEAAFFQLYWYSQIYSSIVVYFDPPYRMSSRRDARNRYDHEMSNAEHQKLIGMILTAAKKLPHVKMMVSHYPDEVYEAAFKDWRCIDFQSGTRHGMADEKLFMNFDKTTDLLSYDYIGDTFTKRQTFDRFIDRNVTRLLRMNPLVFKRIIIEMQKRVNEEVRYIRKDAMAIAEKISEKLLKHCHLVYVGGSLRRNEDTVKDIELIVLPYSKYEQVPSDLFSGEKLVEVRDMGFKKMVAEMGFVRKGHAFDDKARYIKVELLSGISVDIFIPQKHDFFRQLAIRTGSSDFSRQYIATAWSRNGWVGTPDGLRRRTQCEEISKSNWKCVVENPELPPVWTSEKEFFEWLGISWTRFGNPAKRLPKAPSNIPVKLLTEAETNI